MYKKEFFYSLLISLILALRMFGIFIISPLLPVYISGFLNENNLILISIALGVYSLVQCFMQYPFGVLSDKFGRKPIIIIGLIIFIIGLIISAFSKNIYIFILSRIIQGFGVISSILMTLLIDLINKKNYFKSMSIVGFFVGLSFLISLIFSNYLSYFISISGIFLITAFLSLISLLLVIFFIPSLPVLKTSNISLNFFKKIFFNKKLLKLNFGIFVLYLLQIFFFITLPKILSIYINILDIYYWKLYLPIIILSFLFLIFIIIFGKKIISYKKMYILFIIFLFFIQIGFIIFFLYMKNSLNLLSLLFLFFMIGFNFLEAFQRSLISKLSLYNKGSVMGIYSSFQSIGLFLGGMLGGIFSNNRLHNIVYVYWIFSFLIFLWFIISLRIKNFFLKKKK